MGNSGKIALLVGIIVVALAGLVFFYFRSNTSGGGSADGPVQQMPPGPRGRPAASPGTGQ